MNENDEMLGDWRQAHEEIWLDVALPTLCNVFASQIFVMAAPGSFPSWGVAILAHPREGGQDAQLLGVESCDTKTLYFERKN